MKNLEKKIVCLFVATFLCICSLASLLSAVRSRDIENASSSGHPFSSFFAGVYGVSNNIFGKVVFSDWESTVYKLRNGYLAVKQQDVDVYRYYDELEDLKTFLDEQGVGYSFVMTAECGDERQGKLPLGIKTNYCEEVMDDFATMLEEIGIDYIYTYNVLASSGENYYDYFFKTDHHWNDKAGLYLADVLAEHLNDVHNMELDRALLDPAKHQPKVFEGKMFGSLGKKVGYGYASVEDFVLYIPTYETNFKIVQEDRQGAYYDAFIYEEDFHREPIKSMMYHSILYGEHEAYTIQNLNVTNGKRILLLKDSKANIIATHLACTVEYVDFIDLRRFKGNVKDYIAETQPDVVINIQSAFSESVFYEFDR